MRPVQFWVAAGSHGLLTWVGEDELARLDSSLKKNTAFVKRLRALTSEQADSIKAELAGLRLAKYIDEAAASLLENKLRNSGEVLLVLEVCTLFRTKYRGFDAALLELLSRQLAIDKDGPDAGVGMLRQRVLLRLLGELNLIKFTESTQAVFESLRSFLALDDAYCLSTVALGNYFLKHLKPSFLDGEGSLVTAEWSGRFTELFTQFFKSMCRLLVRVHGKLQAIESRGKHYYVNRGDLSEKQADAWSEARQHLESLKALLQATSELLGLPLPALAETASPSVVEGRIVFADLSARAAAGTSQIYDSEEDRAFYEDILSLDSTVPAPEAQGTAEAEAADEQLPDVPDVDPERSGGSPGGTEAFAEGMLAVHTSRMVDKLAADFCTSSSKGLRRALPGLLLDLVRSRADLMPFIGRFLATIKPYFSEVGEALVLSLVGQFKFLSKKTDPIRATRARICRFIGELTKFRVMSQGKAYACLKHAIDNFALYNVDMACLLLETCGRFLLFQPESRERMHVIGEIVGRKKVAGGLDQNRVIMVENALFMMSPPEAAAALQRRERPPLELFITKVIRQDLAEGNAAAVLHTLRTLPWDDPVTRAVLGRLLTRVWKLRDAAVPAVAVLVAGLARHHPDFTTELIDGLLEEVHFAMELNDPTWAQRRTSTLRLVGELYNVGALGADVVVGVLSGLLSVGHPYGIARIGVPAPADPPTDLFRIRLVCTLLQVVGRRFDAGPLRPVLDEFLVGFQYYVCTKHQMSLEVEALLEDTFEALRRDIQYDSIEAAVAALVELSHGALAFLREDLGGPAAAAAEGPGGEPEACVDELDSEFDRLLSGMVSDSLEVRRLERRPQSFEISMPFSQLRSAPESPAAPDQISFKLLLKRKNRPLAKSLHIPVQEAVLRTVLQERRQQDAEKAMLKERTLQTQAGPEPEGPTFAEAFVSALKQIPPPSKAQHRAAKSGIQPRRRFHLRAHAPPPK